MPSGVSPARTPRRRTACSPSTCRAARDAGRPCWLSATRWPTSPSPRTRSRLRTPSSPACIASSNPAASVHPLGAGSESLPVSPWSSSQGASRSRRCSARATSRNRTRSSRRPCGTRSGPTPTALGSSGPMPRTRRRCREVAAPDSDHFFLVGSDVPQAPAGLAYGIWLSDGVDAVFAGTFVPGPGMTVVKVPFDRSRFDRVLITLEIEGDVPTEPGDALWEAAA